MATNLRVAPPLKFSRLTGIAHTLGCKFYELGKNRVVHHNYSVNYYQSIGIIRMSSDARPIALLDRANLTHPQTRYPLQSPLTWRSRILLANVWPPFWLYVWPPFWLYVWPPFWLYVWPPEQMGPLEQMGPPAHGQIKCWNQSFQSWQLRVGRRRA
jgi:hypothetical protein